MYAVERTEQAIEAIREIRSYLDDFADDSDIAKVLLRIRETVNSLAELPTRRRRYLPPVARDPSIRCASAGKYVVYFGIDEPAARVYVLDVQHRRRNPAFVRRRLS